MTAFSKGSLNGAAFSQVTGMVLDVDQTAVPEAEILTIRGHGNPVSLARFSDEAGYGQVFQGDVVRAEYADVLDRDVFGTASKITAVAVMRPVMDL